MYYRPRLIPCLLLREQDLVKTIKFTNPRYLGDPINAVKIFNGKGVDELCVLDISATFEKRSPNFDYLKDIASEAFMPLSYGGGITKIEQIKKLFFIGYEKIIINTAFVQNPQLIRAAADFAGSQSIVVSIDVKTDLFGKQSCFINDGKTKVGINPVVLAKKAEELGAGEILLNSINRDGTMQGYDYDLIAKVSSAVSIPVIAIGGAGNLAHCVKAVNCGASATAVGSLFVYYGPLKAVLINYPTEEELTIIFSSDKDYK